VDESLEEWEKVGKEISSENESVPGKLFILFQARALFCFASSILTRSSRESYNNLIKVSRKLEGECGLRVLDC